MDQKQHGRFEPASFKLIDTRFHSTCSMRAIHLGQP
jgi:hypothetical protein